MILLIDIGNSNITFGVADKSVLLKTLRIETDLPKEGMATCLKALDELLTSIDDSAVEGAVLCSVVPEVTPVVIKTLDKRLQIMPIIVDHRLKTGLQYSIDNPQTLGADRIANAVAAHRLYRNKDLIVIDFGTATTFCTITKEGKYTGGAIMQGIGISAESLNEKTSGLP